LELESRRRPPLATMYPSDQPGERDTAPASMPSKDQPKNQ
jgi:hypothetical protein